MWVRDNVLTMAEWIKNGTTWVLDYNTQRSNRTLESPINHKPTFVETTVELLLPP